MLYVLAQREDYVLVPHPRGGQQVEAEAMGYAPPQDVTLDALMQ